MANIKKRVNNLKVVKDAINPETPEVLAASIIAIDKNLKAMRETGLTDNAVAVLIAGMAQSGVTKTEVLQVFNGLNRLRSYYVKSK